MPEDDYVWLPRSSILTFEEMTRLVGVFTGLGVTRLRLTGGEPLLRHDLPGLVRRLRGVALVTDLALTTNASLLAAQAADLREAGLGRLTVSLDTLRPERLRRFARSDRWQAVVEGIDEAHRVGFRGTKINTVIIRGFNDDECEELLEFARVRDLELRFIEYMDVGGATRWSERQVVSREELLARLERRYGTITPRPADSSAPAERFELPDGTVFGIIASTTRPFCRSCDRARLTADGSWLLCLYAEAGLDLRGPLRAGATDDEVAGLIARAWNRRRDRGAERRLLVPLRDKLHSRELLRADPRREMHTRGG